MPTHVRLIHKVLEGRWHIYTSPDLKGLHISAESQADAQREAITVLHMIADDFGAPHPTVSFESDRQAA